MNDPQKNPAQGIIDCLGVLAESAHVFYTAMIGCGADKAEATAGMQGFIIAWWGDALTNARRENREDEQDE